MYSSIPAKKSNKLVAKDEDRLKLLSGIGVLRGPKVAKQKKLAAQLEMSINQKRRDMEMLRKLGGLKEDTMDRVKTKFVAQNVSNTVTLEESKKTALDVISKLKAKNSSEKGSQVENTYTSDNGKSNLMEEDDEERADSDEIVPEVDREKMKEVEETLNNSSDFCNTDISIEENESFPSCSRKNLKKDDKLITPKTKHVNIASNVKDKVSSKNAITCKDLKHSEGPRLSHLEEIDLNMDYAIVKKLPKDLNSDVKNSGMLVKEHRKEAGNLAKDKQQNENSFEADTLRTVQKSKVVAVKPKETNSGKKVLTQKGESPSCSSKKELKQTEEHLEASDLKELSQIRNNNLESKPNNSCNTAEKSKLTNLSKNKETVTARTSVTKSNPTKTNISMDIPMLLDFKGKQIDLNAPISKNKSIVPS